MRATDRAAPPIAVIPKLSPAGLHRKLVNEWDEPKNRGIEFLPVCKGTFGQQIFKHVGEKVEILQ